ncbi:hypothetical protein OQA88_12610 [Cercophora sp. LCS_1]
MGRRGQKRARPSRGEASPPQEEPAPRRIKLTVEDARHARAQREAKAAALAATTLRNAAAPPHHKYFPCLRCVTGGHQCVPHMGRGSTSCAACHAAVGSPAAGPEREAFLASQKIVGRLATLEAAGLITPSAVLAVLAGPNHPEPVEEGPVTRAEFAELRALCVGLQARVVALEAAPPLESN